QSSGALGHLLKTMEERDSGAFRTIFGPKWGALRDTTMAAKEVDRLRAVDGKELWREPWLTRFKKAGGHKALQAAQNETAARLLLQPMIPHAKALGLATDRGLVMLTAILRRMSFTTGSSAARRDAALQTAVEDVLVKVLDGLSPLKTDAQRGMA